MFYFQFASWKASVIVLISLLIENVASVHLPKLLLISMDGFRYNYLDRFKTKPLEHFNTFVENGVKAEYIENVFPTSTYPNHFSLITGLYPESHGIVHNRFYDTNLQRNFWYDDISDNIDPLWYDVGAEPIYVTNQKAGQGRRSGSVVWPGGIGKVKCIGPDKLISPYTNAFANLTLHERIDYIISWFNSTSDPINLGLLYIPEPDEIAHKYGPESPEVTKYIREDLNEALGYLFDQLKKYELYDSMNIILTADHGFTTVDKFVALDDYIDSSWYTTGSEKDGEKFINHITVQLFPKEGKENSVYDNLDKALDIYIYKKGHREMKELHYSDNERIAPIIVTGKEGVVILKNMSQKATYPANVPADHAPKCIIRGNVSSLMHLNDYAWFLAPSIIEGAWNQELAHKCKGVKWVWKGMHGYIPSIPNMRPFFLALGPAFKKGHKAKHFHNVDIYPLMCHILGITPAPNNGSIDNVIDMLVPTSAWQEVRMLSTTAVTFIVVVGLGVMVAGVFVICACLNARKGTRLLRLKAKHHRMGGEARTTSHHLLDSEDDDEF